MRKKPHFENVAAVNAWDGDAPKLRWLKVLGTANLPVLMKRKAAVMKRKVVYITTVITRRKNNGQS